MDILMARKVFYPFRFILIILNYPLKAGNIFLSKQLQKHRTLKREIQHNKIAVIQLQLVNSQLDPHFIFNTLNTISSKILKGDRYEAYDLIVSFSNMMRSAMLFSDQDEWKMEEELKFTNDYLSLMKVRFKSLFDFTIEVDKDIVEPIYLPRLLIHGFAENAIKHAFSNINYPGVLTIQATRIKSAIEITITDNGIGRVKAMEIAEKSLTKSGNGLRLNGKQVAIFNQLYNTEIHFEIEDLNDNNLLSGTRVLISIPFRK